MTPAALPADHSPADLDRLVAAAQAAADAFGASPAEVRARLLHGLADALLAQRDTLVPLADAESGLGAGRLNGEIERTAFQLRGFAEQVMAGAAFRFTNDPAVAGAPPVGHPPLMRLRVPVGVVAMFSASNFPFAFSVLGGDTASALAAGCPVVVKAHRGHRGLSHAVAALASAVVAQQGLPAGVFGHLDGEGNAIGAALVQHPGIAAAAFTGSVRGGLALAKLAQARPRPIPFYGELGSVNPIVALPAALAANGAALAQTLAGSITLGCGQFCTSPGVILVPTGAAGDAFVADLVAHIRPMQPHHMLNAGIRAGFEAGRAVWAQHPHIERLVDEPVPADAPPKAFLGQLNAADFVADAALHEEVFGPAALVVRWNNTAEAVACLHAVGGALTATLWGADEPQEDTLTLVRAACRIAGRVLFAGVPTGVAVTAGQQHGGPYPASTEPFTTSVGWAAIDRFLRPMALQDAPAWLVQRQGQPC